MKNLNFDEISSSMFVLNDPEELAGIVGGTDPEPIPGGTITNGANGATFTSSTW